jgi:hypothetical protein
MKNTFCLGESSSIQDAAIGDVIQDGGCSGHEITSYRGVSMGLEVGDGCVLFRDPSEMEELHAHMDWVEGHAYRASSVARLRDGDASYGKGAKGADQ